MIWPFWHGIHNREWAQRTAAFGDFFSLNCTDNRTRVWFVWPKHWHEFCFTTSVFVSIVLAALSVPTCWSRHLHSGCKNWGQNNKIFYVLHLPFEAHCGQPPPASSRDGHDKICSPRAIGNSELGQYRDQNPQTFPISVLENKNGGIFFINTTLGDSFGMWGCH